MGVRYKIGNGFNISSWSDVWLGECPLKVKYQNLYNICQDPDISVANSLCGDVWNIPFNRNFGDEEITQCDDLKNSITEVELQEESDTVVWCFEKSGIFSTKSLYRHLLVSSC